MNVLKRIDLYVCVLTVKIIHILNTKESYINKFQHASRTNVRYLWLCDKSTSKQYNHFSTFGNLLVETSVYYTPILTVEIQWIQYNISIQIFPLGYCFVTSRSTKLTHRVLKKTTVVCHSPVSGCNFFSRFDYFRKLVRFHIHSNFWGIDGSFLKQPYVRLLLQLVQP